ncbi:MAG: DUF349 domain-containing protein [Spirosoma sp.]|nr:DUF349 domain-containing protein [Spirosoma sp.]
MANQDQKINQQPEVTSQTTDALAVNTPDVTTTPANTAVEATDTPPQTAESVAATPVQPTDSDNTAIPSPDDTTTDEQSDESVIGETTEVVTNPADVAEPIETPVADEAAVVEQADSSADVDETAELDEAVMPVVEAQTTLPPPAEMPEPDAPAAVAEAIDASAPAETDVMAQTDMSHAVSDDTPIDEAETVAAAVEEDVADITEAEETEPVSSESDNAATEDETIAEPAADYSQFSKTDFVSLLEGQITIISASAVMPADFKRADRVLKDTKPLFDQMKRAEREAALQLYTAQAEEASEEGFTFKHDDEVLRYDELYKQIKSQKNTYFQNLDKAKDGNFTAKTELLTRLRELVESDETNAVDQKASWNEFKKIQDEWKAAGNMNSPHNATLWATFHALVDRYFSNRNIYFELKELDRKKNIGLKTEVIEKVEAMAKASDETPVTRQTIDDANALFEEYKHIGPAPKAEQEVLWARMKAALDILYDKRRDQTNEQRKESAQLYEEKSAIYEELIPLTSFSSNSINDWNDRTKVVMGLQDRWNAIKGPMPRDEGKDLSKKFWASLKTFFANKGEFFRQLESKREDNLRQKTELCEQVEAILAAGEESPEITQTVIELQRQWKNIGQVPEKQKNSIFERFKAACDAFFDKKRARNQDTEREFEDNLTKKIALIERIEAATTENADLSQLEAFRQEWLSIGFVPKKDKEATQKRYINAVNALVSATGQIPAKDKERIMLQSEAEATRTGGSRAGGPRSDRRSDAGARPGGNRERGGPREGSPQEGGNRDRNRGGGNRGSRDQDDDRDYGRNTYRDDYNRGDSGGSKREGDLRRRITAIENDIATYRNNIEFFARSKNADQLRADIDRKIAESEKQIDELRHQLRVEQA